MDKSMKIAVGKGGAYIYIEMIAQMVAGYLFWIIISKVATPDIVGISSAVVSFGVIITTVVILGIPSGIQRFLGNSFAQENRIETNIYIHATLLLISLAFFGCSVAIGILGYSVYEGSALLLMAIFFVGTNALSIVLRAIIVSSLKTRLLPLVMIVTSGVKIVLGITLVLMGFGAQGLILSFTVQQLLSSILLGIGIISILRKSFPAPVLEHPKIKLLCACRNAFAASFPFWVPSLITITGIQLGVVVVFGLQGSNQAGIFFIPFTIVNGITAATYSLFTIAMPVLSSMADGRKRFTWHSIRLSLIFSLPFSSSMIFYSREILDFLGPSYVEGTLSFQIMLLSILPATIQFGITMLSYSYGNYRQVLLIGLASSIPRMALYFALVPFYGGLGASVGYTVGTFIGCVLAVLIGKRLGLDLYWKDLVVLLLIPILFSLTLRLLTENFAIGIFLSTVLSYVSLLKMRILDRSDLKDAVSILPTSISQRIFSLLKDVNRGLDRM